MTEPIEITDEIRRAVHAEDCEYQGHNFDTSQLLGYSDEPNPNNARGGPMPVLRATDPTRLPHLRCTRCERVWLLIDTPGFDYADAVAQTRRRLGSVSADVLTPIPKPGVGGRPLPTRPALIARSQETQ